MPHDTAIVIMAKQPKTGFTKTRLCPPFQPGEAAAFYEAMLKDTIALVAALESISLAVAITPLEAQTYFEEITPPGAILLPVSGATIGECLSRALDDLLALGFRKVVALNADGPSLPPAFLYEAVALLNDHDLVLGPGEDGGYYLVGLKERLPAIFEGIAWSTGHVLAQTLSQANRLGLKSSLTSPWYDVDFASDVLRLRQELGQLPENRLVHTRQFFGSTLTFC